MNDLISVIIPVYKTENYIRKCIESVINQTYKNLEIILVDDGSPDNCGKICDEYATIDQRVQVIHQRNSGLSVVRNVGIKTAKGQYISFIDSDDYMDPEMLEILLTLLREYNADISICDFQEMHSNQKAESTVIEKAVKTYSNVEALEASCFFKKKWSLHADFYWNALWNKLYFSEIFHEISFPKGRIYEDISVIYRLIYRSRKVVGTNEILYYYQQRYDSITKGQANLFCSFDILDAYTERFEYLKDKGLIELYQSAAFKYFKLIIFVYFQLKEFGNTDVKIYKNLIKKYREKFENIKAMTGIPFKEKIDLYVFYVNPRFYNTWNRIRKNKFFKRFLKVLSAIRKFFKNF